MKVYRRGDRYDYVEGNYRRAIHTEWYNLTGEKILPVTRRADAEYYGVKIFDLRHNKTRSDGVEVGYALPLYLERCRVKGLSGRSVTQRKQQILYLSASTCKQNGDSVYIDTVNVNEITARHIQSRLDSLKCKGSSQMYIP